MRTKLNLADLRMQLAVKLAVAPRHVFKTLWSPQSRPGDTDSARQQLVDHMTEGWDSLEIEANGHEIPLGHAHSTGK